MLRLAGDIYLMWIVGRRVGWLWSLNQQGSPRRICQDLPSGGFLSHGGTSKSSIFWWDVPWNKPSSELGVPFLDTPKSWMKAMRLSASVALPLRALSLTVAPSLRGLNRSWVQHIHLQPWTQVCFPYLSNKWSPSGNNIGGIFLKFIPRIWGINNNYCGWFVALWALDHLSPLIMYIFMYTHIYAPIVSPSCPHHITITTPSPPPWFITVIPTLYPLCIPLLSHNIS